MIAATSPAYVGAAWADADSGIAKAETARTVSAASAGAPNLWTVDMWLPPLEETECSDSWSTRAHLPVILGWLPGPHPNLYPSGLIGKAFGGSSRGGDA